MLSLIVPCYNEQEALPFFYRETTAVLAEMGCDYELLFVNDGSRDGTLGIIKEYAEKDPRIRVIHQDNHGVSAARNAGLLAASGDYLGFVDPDDLICPEMYASMIRAAEDIGAEIAICGFSYCAEDGSPVRQEPVTPGVFSRKDLILSIYGMPNPFHGSMCNKIFSRAVLDGLAFDETVAIGEDWLLLYECYLRAEKAAALEECFYTVRLRADSATRKRTAQLHMKRLAAYDRLYRCAEGKDREIRSRAVQKILDTYTGVKSSIIREDYDKKSLIRLNRRMRQIAVSSFLRGDLSFKRAFYHVLKGFQIQ